MYKTHGMSGTRFYGIFAKALRRCNKSDDKDYHGYGGRGVRFHWETFSDFKADMYTSYLASVDEYGEKDVTLDRVDNSKGYSKDNCRWATRREQANNRTNNHRVNFAGENLTMAEWAKNLNVSRSTLKSRIYRGWKVEKILTKKNYKYRDEKNTEATFR